MTARQIIQEIKDLPRSDQEEVLRAVQSELQESKAVPAVQYIDRDEALKAADRIFAERADLFKKLAE